MRRRLLLFERPPRDLMVSLYVFISSGTKPVAGRFAFGRTGARSRNNSLIMRINPAPRRSRRPGRRHFSPTAEKTPAAGGGTDAFKFEIPLHAFQSQR